MKKSVDRHSPGHGHFHRIFFFDIANPRSEGRKRCHGRAARSENVVQKTDNGCLSFCPRNATNNKPPGRKPVKKRGPESNEKMIERRNPAKYFSRNKPPQCLNHAFHNESAIGE